MKMGPRALLSMVRMGSVLLTASVLALTTCGAETITLGVRDIPKDLNVVTSDHPAAQLLRGGLTAPLTSLTEDGQLTLVLADSIRLNASHNTWSLRVRFGARFGNGEAIRAEDVVYSLQECMNRGFLKGATRVSPRTEQITPALREEWVDLEVNQDVAREMPGEVAQCPILSARLAKLFGKDLGFGTNVPSAGPYELQSMKAGRQYELRRVLRERGVDRGGGAESVVVRGFQDPQHGLIALREGTVDALFGPDEKSLALAQRDETLVIGSCIGQVVLHRKGFQLPCRSGVNVASLRYIQE